MAGFIWLHHAQAEAFMATLPYCNLPTSLLLFEGLVLFWVFLFFFTLRKSWRLTVGTLLPLPGARVDQVQQPGEAEGEEGGEAVLLGLRGRVWADGVSRQW